MHPASSTMGIGSLSWRYSGRGVVLTTHPHLVPRLQKDYGYNSAPHLGLNPLNAKLNPICHLLALLRAHHILHVSGIRVNALM